MASDESDDEPLSVLAAAKKSNPHKFESAIILEAVEPKKRKLVPSKKSGLTIKINRKLNTVTAPVIERPADVWLYLKDLNPTGPYKCLLCSDWFINRAKMIIHYVLNHKKDFCGICRYFVPDRETWWQHVKFHTPWPCSQCIETFQSEAALRQHLSLTHKLVHCRLCHFRVPVGDQYDKHLFQKHNVTNVNSKEEESLWEFDVQGLPKFNCYLCSKLENLTSTFFNHYMGYHHFTLKCLASFISGKDAPFSVNGADVSSQFIDGQLKGLKRFGYVDLDQKLDDATQDVSQEAFLQDVSQDASQEASQENFQEPFQEASQETSQSETNDSIKVVDIEIKSEVTSEGEEQKPGKGGSDNKDKSKPVNPHLDYKGDEDFDITLAELVILEKCYFDYISKIMSDLAKKTVPEISNITIVKRDTVTPVDCPICHTKCPKLNPFINHMSKMHGIKAIPSHTCRVCATTFETNGELESHITEELGEFEDLWICQFCDKEFDNRKETRKHLSEHWDMLEYDNCFSPHLGFKCRYCPTLFWNETDRETHQVRVHLNKLTDHFYKCNICSITFSDKVWFIHHHMEKHANESEQTKVYLLKCCLCCVVLTNIDEMRSHFDEHHPEARKLFCSLPPCKYKPLSHRKSFKLHVKTMHGPCSRTEKVYCSVCGREFPSSRSCNAHMSQVHGPGKFKCKLCKVVLHTMDERKLHYLLCHPGRHPFECTECGKSFQYKSSLYMHKQEHQPNKQSYTCSYCSKVFVKKDSYREHVQIHEGPRHACSYCPMRFVQRSNMLRHERRHTGERPYACPHCPRTFADKGACTSHARTHSKDTSYACLYCGQTFVQKSKLTYHIRKHTGENLETCTICSKLFTSACALREHMKIHLCKKESVQCPLCDKKYQDERYMLRHLRTSHTRAQFTCPLCRKVLTSAAGLRHHVITHSSLNTFRCKVCPKSYAVKRSIMKHLRRRHMLNSEEINLKDYYTRLEPRECELKLDEETMTSIFGPPKKKVNDILIGDFVTYSKNLKLKDGGNDEQSEAGKDSDSDDESQRDDDTEQAGRDSGNEEELEPTDFVSVKIEPLDDYEFTE